MAELSGWTIVVVEDKPDDQAVLSTILEHHGAEVHIAGNGTACLELLKSVDATLIITDLAMPGMDGWDMMVQLRTNPDSAHIPVVAVTAYHSAEVAEEARLRHFDGYFPKPLDPAFFVPQIRKIVSGG